MSNEYDVLSNVSYCSCGRGLMPSGEHYYADAVTFTFDCPACNRRWSTVVTGEEQ